MTGAMKNKKIITLLCILIALAASVACSFGILETDGPGQYEYKSIRGETVLIYGRGLYKDMSAEVAVQGIAQDYVTAFIGVPILIIALLLAVKNSLKGRLLLSGVLLYFMLTYLFYTSMGMYNKMFLVYVFLLGTSLYALLLTLFSFNISEVEQSFRSHGLFKYGGIFLIVNACLIALLWLSVIVPPLINGSIIPIQVEHYTTLIVQGFDLGIFLPMAFISGYLVIKKNIYGYLFTPVYMIFLTLLMVALVSKLLFMAAAGSNVVPVIFIIPSIAIISIIFSILLLRNIKELSLLN